MSSNSIRGQKAQLDKEEREHLEDTGISRRQELVSNLAKDLDDYIELAHSISDECETVSSGVSSEWSDRALSEITTAGYQPNRKHGVEINIKPLADAEVVPKTVDEKIL